MQNFSRVWGRRPQTPAHFISTENLSNLRDCYHVFQKKKNSRGPSVNWFFWKCLKSTVLTFRKYCKKLKRKWWLWQWKCVWWRNNILNKIICTKIDETQNALELKSRIVARRCDWKWATKSNQITTRSRGLYSINFWNAEEKVLLDFNDYNEFSTS